MQYEQYDAERIWARAHQGVPENWPKDKDGNLEEPTLLEGIDNITKDMLDGWGIPVVTIDLAERTYPQMYFGGKRGGYVFVPVSRLEEVKALMEAPPIWDDEEIEGDSEDSGNK